jgi:hypothetical protein
MVSFVAAAWMAFAVANAEAPASSIGPAPEQAAPVDGASTTVKKALEKGKYPWYDPKTETVKPVWPPDLTWLTDWLERWFGRRRIPGIGRIGDLIAIGLAMLALAVFLVVLIELWRRYRPVHEGDAVRRSSTGASARIEGLPAGVRPESDDPWAEAQARRARGDLAGAIVCLFAHQLLSLDRLRQIRLVPGRTGRQYIRTISNREIRSLVEPTLHLFEAVYYGHHLPSVEAFERVWALAVSFEQRVGAGVVA